jgi:hypothetical protein
MGESVSGVNTLRRRLTPAGRRPHMWGFGLAEGRAAACKRAAPLAEQGRAAGRTLC